MADAYSRTGAGVGILAATSGGGALEHNPGIGGVVGQPSASAGAHRTATDDVGTAAGGVSGHQRSERSALDGNALFSAVSVSCQRVLTEPADIVGALPRALSAATSIGGPAVLLLPKDIQPGRFGYPVAEDSERARARCDTVLSTGRQVGDPALVVQLLRSIDERGASRS